MQALISKVLITGMLFATRGNISYDQVRAADRKGTGVQFQMFGSGSTTTGHVAVYDANGNVIDGGAASGGTTNQNIRTIGVSFDGGGGVVAASTRCEQVNYAGTIQQFTMIGDVSGTATITVKTVAFASYTGPASASDISSGGETMTTAISKQDSTLSGWTTSLSANTVVCFALTSPSTVTWLAANIKVAAN